MQYVPRMLFRLSEILRHPLGGYALAIGAAIATAAVMLVLRPFVHPYVSPPFLFVVLIVARKLGLGPAIAASGVSVIAFAWLFVTPYDPVITDEAEVAATVVFLSTLMIAWLAATVRSRDTRVSLLTREASASPEEPETSHAKDDVVAILARDLRSQLVATRAALQALETGPHDPESASRTRASVVHEIEHLGRIVDDLLDVHQSVSRRRVGARAPSSAPSRPAC
jgi:signal transduction histidine kinase